LKVKYYEGFGQKALTFIKFQKYFNVKTLMSISNLIDIMGKIIKFKLMEIIFIEYHRIEEIARKTCATKTHST